MVDERFARIGEVCAFGDERFVSIERCFKFIGRPLLLVGEPLAFVEARFDFIGEVFKSVYARVMLAGRLFAATDAIFAARDYLSLFIEEHPG